MSEGCYTSASETALYGNLDMALTFYVGVLYKHTAKQKTTHSFSSVQFQSLTVCVFEPEKGTWYKGGHENEELGYTVHSIQTKQNKTNGN